MRNSPRLCGIRFRIESLRQIAAELVGSNFRLRIFARTFRVFPREVRVHAVNESELPVAADMVVVRVRVEDHYRAGGQFRGDFVNVADTHSGVEEHGLLGADDQIGNRFFRLMRLVDGKNSRRDFVDFKPGVVGKNALERFVFRPRKRTAPLWLTRFLRCTKRAQRQDCCA